MSESKTFADFNLSETTVAAITSKGFTSPTPVQAEVIPALLEGTEDLIAQAKTGTGKTAAFGIPLIEKIQPTDKGVQALVLAPTRELAIQVAEEIRTLCGEKPLWVTPVYGGAAMNLQISKLKKGSHIVVGTPGRILDHIERGTIDLSTVKYVVLDEADEMLNMGFIEDVEAILSKTSAEQRQTLLFSATMPPRIEKLAKQFMKSYRKIGVTNDAAPTELARQVYYEVAQKDKFTVLRRILDISDDFYGIIFCRTKIDVDELSHRLMEAGYLADGLHGDLNQVSREIIMNKFKRQLCKVLVATDVAARGLDVSGLTHVVNFAVPADPETYTHRVGRTGRAGKPGTAITFVSPSDRRLFRMIQKEVRNTVIEREIIPDIKEIVKSKRRRLHESLTSLVGTPEAAEYNTFAEKLLEGREPRDVVAAVVRYAFDGSLLKEDYDELSDPIHNVEKRADSRREKNFDPDYTPNRRNIKIRIHKGRDDNFTRRDFAKWMEEKTGVPGKFIDIVDLTANETYVHVSERDADQILERLNAAAKGERIAEKVNVVFDKDDPRRGGSSGGRGGFSRGGDRGGFRKDGERGGFGGKGSFGRADRKIGDKPAFASKKSYPKKTKDE
jgi:ATP-dependent RNA helicase DeaD